MQVKQFRIFLGVLFMFFVLSAVNAQDSGEKDLRWAKSLMEKGDYAYAIEKFEDIARSEYNSGRIRKEAMYFAGYCHVKNNDPWQAVRVFERFLEKYDDGISSELIPDALYVLGRVYEETSDQRNAIKVYQRCAKNYPGNSFARKSKDRLKELGGGSNTDPFDDGQPGGYDPEPGHGHDNDHGQPGSASGISREIRQLLKTAETVSNSYTRDQMLLEGADRARTGDDFVAIAKAISNDFTRSQIFDKVRANKNYQRFTAASMVELAGFINNSYMKDQFLVNLAADFARRDYVSNYDFVEFSAAMNNDAMRQQLFDAVTGSTAFKFMNARTVADLANTCKNAYIHDQLLVTAAQKNGYSLHELLILADACTNSFNKTQILSMSGSSSGHYRRNATAVSEASDPFAGFTFDKGRINRINDFISAVESRKLVGDKARLLQKDDLRVKTVGEYLEKYRQMQKFDSLHQQK